MFFSKDYKLSFEELTKNHDALARELMDLRQKYEAEIQLNSSLTNCLEAERDKAAALELEIDRMASPDEYIDQLKRERNRAYANGRMDAYAELGVRVLDAKAEGNTVSVAIDDDARVTDVVEEIPDAALKALIDEIEIDDLVDVY